MKLNVYLLSKIVLDLHSDPVIRPRDNESNKRICYPAERNWGINIGKIVYTRHVLLKKSLAHLSQQVGHNERRRQEPSTAPGDVHVLPLKSG